MPTQNELKSAVSEFLDAFAPTHYMHLVDLGGRGLCNGTNPEVILRRGRQLLRRLHTIIDRDLLRLGTHFYRRPLHRRSQFIAFPEQLHWNPHYHALVRLPDSVSDIRFLTGIWFPWIKLTCPTSSDIFSGAAMVGRINQRIGATRINKYCSKDLWRSRDLDSMIISTEFHPD